MSEFAKNQPPNQEAVEAHNAAQYAVLSMDIDYDPPSGLMKATMPEKIPATFEEIEEGSINTVEITGPPGCIMTHEGFYFPRGKADDKRLALAFELGYLFGVRQQESSEPTDPNISE